MGSNKLLLPLGGVPGLAHVLRAALKGGLAPIILVRGPHSPDFSALIAAFGPQAACVECLTAPDAAKGQAHSLRAGLGRVRTRCPDATGVMVLLGDQPLVRADLVTRLREFFQHPSGNVVPVAPAYQGRRGNPVVLPASLFASVEELEGDSGARALLASAPPRLLSCPDDACLRDMDTLSQYHQLAARFS